MSGNGLIVTALALVVILGLAFYAGSLLRKVKEQEKARLDAVNKRNTKIMESVHLIAKAMTEGQCNLSEGAIRQAVLLATLQFKLRPDFESEFKAMFELYDKVKEMPTHEARKKYKRNEIMRFDKDREQHEARLEADIVAEMSVLKSYQIQPV